jgi:hypothetical protein
VTPSRRHLDPRIEIRRPYALRPDADPETLALVAREALTILRPVLDSAWIDEPLAHGLPASAEAALAQLRATAQAQVMEGRLPRTDGPHLGVDIDPAEPEQLATLAQLAPFTTATEAYTAAEDELLRAGEGELCLSLTSEEHATLVARLGAAGDLLEQR